MRSATRTRWRWQPSLKQNKERLTTANASGLQNRPTAGSRTSWGSDSSACEGCKRYRPSSSSCAWRSICAEWGPCGPVEAKDARKTQICRAGQHATAIKLLPTQVLVDAAPTTQRLSATNGSGCTCRKTSAAQTPRGAGACAHLPVHVGVLRGMAHAPGLGAIDVCRRRPCCQTHARPPRANMT